MDVEESSDEAPFWAFLPDTVLLHIFQFLTAPELLRTSQVCHSWYRVACDEFLWRDLLHHDYNIDRSIGLAPGNYVVPACSMYVYNENYTSTVCIF